MTRLGIQLTVDDVETDGNVVDHSMDSAVNTVKIDGSLIAGLADPGSESRATVEKIVERCLARGICTVAEAVETAEQVVVLREIGAETAQGYFFSHPFQANEAADLAAMDPRARFALSAPPAF